MGVSLWGYEFNIGRSLAAAKLNIKVAHVEAGMRSYNRAMPEEINRELTDHLSSLLFCPTDTAVANLAHEGIQEGVYQVGDIMCDALMFFKQQAAHFALPSHLTLNKPYAVATVHRAENTDNRERLCHILHALFSWMLPSYCLFTLVPKPPFNILAMAICCTAERFNLALRYPILKC